MMKKLTILLLVLSLASCQPTGPSETEIPKEPDTQVETDQETEENPVEEIIEPETKEETEELLGEEIQYRNGAMLKYDEAGTLGGIYSLQAYPLPDLNAMGLYTYTFFYDEDPDEEKFIFFPRYKETEVEIYRLIYNSETNQLTEKDMPMFTHKMKPDEVFVLIYTLREGPPEIVMKFRLDDQVVQWILQRG